MTRLEELRLGGNLSLASLDLGALETVDTLSVINNPSLVTAPLADVQTFETSILHNADGPQAP